MDVFQILKWLETNGLFSITTLAARNMIPHLNLGKNWNILLMDICTRSVIFFKAMMIKDFQGDIWLFKRQICRNGNSRWWEDKSHGGWILLFKFLLRFAFGYFQIFVETDHKLIISMECEGIKRVCKYRKPIYDPDDPILIMIAPDYDWFAFCIIDR